MTNHPNRKRERREAARQNFLNRFEYAAKQISPSLWERVDRDFLKALSYAIAGTLEEMTNDAR